MVEEALRVLRRGGLIIYPTDTVYGLGADPWNGEASRRVHEVKARSGKPLPLLLHSLGDAHRYGVVTRVALRLAREFWPGQLTLILKLKALDLPYWISMGTGKIALRVPDCQLARMIARGLGGAVIGTSANISGAPPPRTAGEALAQLGGSIDLVLDGGATRYGIPSTIIDLTTDPPRLIRRGAVDPEEVRAVIGELVG